MKDSIHDPLLHEQLLLGYVSALYENGSGSDQTAKRLRHMQSRFLCTGNVWRKIFEMQGDSEDEKVQQQVYELWSKENMVEATISYAERLLKKGKGKEASGLIVRAKGLVGQNEQEEMETRWVRVIGVN